MNKPQWVEQMTSSPWSHSDKDLLALALEGDKAAAKKIVKQLSPQAHALAWRMLGDSHQAQDAVQEAFVKLLKIGCFNGSSSLATYFYTIVSRVCLDRLRVVRHQPSLQDEDLALLDEGLDPQQTYAQAQRSHKVQRALMALPSRQRIALSLWAYQDATAQDIAATLAIETNAAHQLLHRAKINLRQLAGGKDDQ